MSSTSTGLAGAIGRPKRMEPKLDEERLKDLRKRVERSCEELKKNPEPSAIFEMDKKHFGMTFERYSELMFSWKDYLQDGEQIEGESSQSKNNNRKRKGPDHDTWKAFEKRLNSFDHYQCQIEDINLHFIWERASTDASQMRTVIPLVLLHGWPSSIVDFLNVIHPLAHPGTNAPSHIPAFDIVVPSQTGYLWSSSPQVDQFGRGQHSGPQGDLLLRDEARIIHKLMLSLGYRKYAIQAGDWASAVTRLMAKMYPDHVIAVHLNFCPASPPNLEPPLFNLASKLIPNSIKSLTYAITPTSITALCKNVIEFPAWRDRKYYLSEPGTIDWIGYYLFGFPRPLNEQERKKVKRSIQFTTTGSAYAMMQGSRPSTLGLVLQSDPGALLAWIGEKYIQWTDEDPTNSEIVSQLTLYWCTNTMPRSIYNYRNRPERRDLPPSEYVQFIKQPFGFSDFPFELMPQPLDWMKRTGNMKWYRKHENGGHFASMENPTIYVDDIRDCFSLIWKPGR